MDVNFTRNLLRLFASTMIQFSYLIQILIFLHFNSFFGFHKNIFF